MEKLRIENLSTKEMTSVFAGGIFNKFFGPIGIIYTICGIVDDFQKGWQSVDNQLNQKEGVS